jgi:chromosomal replication initiation ATPase DnaA
MTAWPVRIGAPDDDLLGAVLVKQLADRQIRVDQDVVAFLTRRMERSFAAARAVVRALDRASLRARRPITMPLARAVLDELAAERAGEGES